MPGVMVDQHEALVVTTGHTDTVYLVLPNTGIFNCQPLDQPAASLNFTTKLCGTWVKGKGWNSACYPFPEAILVQATTSTPNH